MKNGAATRRASEIGLRKVMGAFRSSLIRQILGEAMIIVAISILISLLMVHAALPVFNELSGKEISFNTDNFVFLGFALHSRSLPG